jgi:ElaB/YqjD/DUF883 family membrane-anchored ribosome-binding protein
MSNFRDNLSKNFGSTRSSIESSLHDAKDIAREGMEHLRHAASDAKSMLDEKLHATRQQASDVGGRLSESWEHMRSMDSGDYNEVWDDVKTRVRENPGPALMIAAGVGIAVGLIMALNSTPKRRW